MLPAQLSFSAMPQVVTLIDVLGRLGMFLARGGRADGRGQDEKGVARLHVLAFLQVPEVIDLSPPIQTQQNIRLQRRSALPDFLRPGLPFGERHPSTRGEQILHVFSEMGMAYGGREKVPAEG